MIEIIPGMPGNILAFKASGEVTEEDYETVLVPAIEEKLKTNGKIRILYRMEADFLEFSAAALWEDAKVGLKHLAAYEKIAFVSDVHWMNSAVRMFGLLVPCPVRVFAGGDLDGAKAWLGE